MIVCLFSSLHQHTSVTVASESEINLYNLPNMISLHYLGSFLGSGFAFGTVFLSCDDDTDFSVLFCLSEVKTLKKLDDFFPKLMVFCNGKLLQQQCTAV